MSALGRRSLVVNGGLPRNRLTVPSLGLGLARQRAALVPLDVGRRGGAPRRLLRLLAPAADVVDFEGRFERVGDRDAVRVVNGFDFEGGWWRGHCEDTSGDVAVCAEQLLGCQC